MEHVTSYSLHGSAHDFMNKMFGGKRKIYTGAFMLMQLLLQ